MILFETPSQAYNALIYVIVGIMFGVLYSYLTIGLKKLSKISLTESDLNLNSTTLQINYIKLKKSILIKDVFLLILKNILIFFKIVLEKTKKLIKKINIITKKGITTHTKTIKSILSITYFIIFGATLCVLALGFSLFDLKLIYPLFAILGFLFGKMI